MQTRRLSPRLHPARATPPAPYLRRRQALYQPIERIWEGGEGVIALPVWAYTPDGKFTTQLSPSYIENAQAALPASPPPTRPPPQMGYHAQQRWFTNWSKMHSRL